MKQREKSQAQVIPFTLWWVLTLFADETLKIQRVIRVFYAPHTHTWRHTQLKCLGLTWTQLHVANKGVIKKHGLKKQRRLHAGWSIYMCNEARLCLPFDPWGFKRLHFPTPAATRHFFFPSTSFPPPPEEARINLQLLITPSWLVLHQNHILQALRVNTQKCLHGNRRHPWG